MKQTQVEEPKPEYVAKSGASLQRKNGKIWSHIRCRWLVETPEEYVRQEYLLILRHEYGYDLEQMAEEMEVTGRGSGHARADFVVWRSALDKADQKPPLVIVECKSDNVTIRPADYGQGDNYARLANAPFFVTHNNTETKFWRVRKDRMPGYLEEIEDIPHADATDRQIDALLTRLKTFKEDEFAALLHQCHNVIRNREKIDPVAAFDEIAKILFIKVYVEREMKRRQRRDNLFTVEFLETQLADNPLEDLFQKTKAHYETDRIFAEDERLNLKPATGLEIVRLLERYNLSDTSEDIKGIAFERFLGKTFRGEIGQFFTPRPIVEFMVRMVDPQEGDVICDPASGSGGFLIRFFEIVRERILADVDRRYQAFRRETDGATHLAAEEKAAALRDKYEELQRTLDKDVRGSRMWNLANDCIYGTDANDRMARTSKMNMIMHGDGHGGVHHHDGFLNVNGIFDGRFDIILTNPPFGASVEPSDTVLEEQTAIPAELERRYADRYGNPYRDALSRVRAAVGKPIASLFALPTVKGNRQVGKIKTELLFIERCLDLLKPGGRLGIVLPEGVFNNPSLAYVREFCEDRAFIRAVVSLPPETFVSSGATVKASLLFMQKFTDAEQADFNAKKDAATQETCETYAAENGGIFATLVTPDAEGELQATHLPLLLKRDAGRLGMLAGHMAKANTHWKAFNMSRESLVVFHGPHAYISPRWYSTDEAVPTWNYVVVHAFGMPRVLQEAEGMEAHLRQLIRYHEGTGPESWRPEKLSQETYAALLKAIVCFEMPILRIEGKAKLGQNRSRRDIVGLVEGLQGTDRAADHELAKITQSRVLETLETPE